MPARRRSSPEIQEGTERARSPICALVNFRLPQTVFVKSWPLIVQTLLDRTAPSDNRAHPLDPKSSPGSNSSPLCAPRRPPGIRQSTKNPARYVTSILALFSAAQKNILSRCMIFACICGAQRVSLVLRTRLVPRPLHL